MESLLADPFSESLAAGRSHELGGRPWHESWQGRVARQSAVAVVGRFAAVLVLVGPFVLARQRRRIEGGEGVEVGQAGVGDGH